MIRRYYDISTQIIAVLDDLCRRFGLAIDWTQDNIWPYIQELAGKYINWEMATSWALIILAGVVFLFGFILFVGDVVRDWDGLGVLFGLLLIAAGLILGGFEIYDILTCIHFPEKKIFDYVSTLMKNS